MTMIKKIRKPGLTVLLWLYRIMKSKTPAAKHLEENRITKGRRAINRLQLITELIVLIRIVILFCIAAVAASALLSVFFEHQQNLPVSGEVSDGKEIMFFEYIKSGIVII
jgi:hypothetical protein